MTREHCRETGQKERASAVRTARTSYTFSLGCSDDPLIAISEISRFVVVYFILFYFISFFFFSASKFSPARKIRVVSRTPSKQSCTYPTVTDKTMSRSQPRRRLEGAWGGDLAHAKILKAPPPKY